MGYYSNHYQDHQIDEEHQAYEELCAMTEQQYYGAVWEEEEAFRLATEDKKNKAADVAEANGIYTHNYYQWESDHNDPF